MLGNILPPYHSLQELNLDWILTKVKDMLRFLPDDGSVGQILRRTAHGAEWSNEQGGGGAVNSVNGQTGDVVLTASDVGALPDTTVIPTDTSDLTNNAGFVDAAGAAAAAPVQSVNGQTGAVTITAPVTSVNGQTGAVTLSIPTPLDAYPVGSIYMSVNNTSPSVLFGGTWQQIEDTFLLSAGQTYTAGDTGGEAAHTLTSQELPSGLGEFAAMAYPQDGNTNGIFSITSQRKDTSWTSGNKYGTAQFSADGGGQAHNNMPPYLVVYMWQRTA